MASSAAGSSSKGATETVKVDPILRNAIRYSVSPREYRALHAFLSKRSATRPVAHRAPEPGKYDAAIAGQDDFHAAAVRSALRTFLASQAGLKVYDLVIQIVLRRGATQQSGPKTRFSPNTRLSASLAGLIYLHRMLYRFFTRVRGNLLTQDAAPFRRRNPRVSRALTSRIAPAVGASLAGLTLCAYPADQFRLTVAIYMASRAAEFVYNAMEDEGYFKDVPWVTSAILMPFVYGQLLHAFLFDRDCFPAPFGNFILRFSNTYVQPRPAHLPETVAWPDVYRIVDCLADASRLKYPPFESPILFPDAQTSLPPVLAPVQTIVATAHPAIKNLTCAMTHPSDPSCVRTHVFYWLDAFPRLVRVFAVIFGALSVLRWKAFYAAPIPALNALAKRILKMSTFAAGSIGMGWGTICAFQALLPRTFMPTQRWFLGGFVGGLWAFLMKDEGRAQFLYCARQSIDSTWKVGKKHGWWRGIKNGDVYVVCAGLAVASAVYDHNPEALRSRLLSGTMQYLRGPRAADEDETAAKKANDTAKEAESDVVDRAVKATGVEK